MKHLLYITFGLLVIASCKKSNQFVVSGSVQNGGDKKLVFSELLVNGTKELDSLKLNENGTFRFKSITENPKFYHLSVSKNNFLTLLIEPGENVTIVANASDMNKASINGSDGSLHVQKLNNSFIATKHKLDSLKEYVRSIEADDDFENRIAAINKLYAEIAERQRDSSIAFIVSNLESLASILALYQKYDDENYVLYKNRDLQYIKIVSEALEKKYPESQHVKALIADRENLFRRYNQFKANKKLNELANSDNVLSFPEIYLPDRSGDSISLNSIKSKYILLNFWASWSKESIARNIELIDVYKQYHAKGFEIYQVSLDTKEENWSRAIDFDQLPWINVIDLNGRTSYYAKIYNVRNLPTSFLINPEREIAILNPTKQELISTLNYALK